MDLFKLLGTIAVDNSEANKAIKETTDAARGAGDELSDAGSKASSKFGGAMKTVGKGAVAVGKTVVTGLGVAAGALGGITVKALSAAGELEQNMGGSEAVFKDHAGKMQETAKTAFSNMGLSASDFLGTANKMGALFQGAGFGIEESATMSADAMQRAADVASIMGIDTSAAMEAIAGAAKGNFTMMDNLGVAMNDTTIQAYALSKGIDKSTQDMTNQEKIGLAMEMFMEKTAYAAGNYAKENETLAGSLGTAKAALSNFLSGAGTVEDVVSSFSNAANVIVKNINSMFPALMTGITQLVNQLVPLIPPLLGQLLPGLISGAVGLINGLVAALPSVLDILLNSALPQLLSGVQVIFESLISALPSLVQSLASALPGLVSSLITGLVSMIVTLCTYLPQIIQPLIDNLPMILESVVTGILSNLGVIIQGLVSLVVALIPMIPQIVNLLVDAVLMYSEEASKTLVQLVPVLLVALGEIIVALCKALPSILLALFNVATLQMRQLWILITTLFEPLASWLNENVVQPVLNFFRNLWDGIKVVWDGICNAVSIAVQLIGSILSAAFQIITLPFRFIWENCKEYVFAAFEWIKQKISVAINFIKNLVQVGFGFVKDKIINPIIEAKNKVVETFNNIRTSIQEKISAVKNKVSEIFGNIKTKISETVNSIKTTVTNVFNKVKDAMEKPIQKARDTIKGIVDKIKGLFSGLKLKFPNIKLPHFGIKPKGWKIDDLLEGSIPKLSIEWYAKAMRKPQIMTEPTVFGYNAATGKLQGGGEAGSEVVTGTGTLMGMIRAAVSSENGAIVYYLQKLVEILAKYFPEILASMGQDIVLDDGTLVAKLAPGMDKALGQIRSRKDRGR